MKTANRLIYGQTLVELAEKYDFYVMDADLAKATGTKAFADKYPERFIDTGIAEANMISTAAGLSSCGLPVIASTFAMFGAGRAYEQIRNSIAYPQANVKIICSHAGVMIGEDGPSHQCIEDLSLMRTIPGMTVLAPCDGIATKALVEEALKYNGPVYIRFGRRDVEQVYKENADFRIGKSNKLQEGNDACIFACGEEVQEALIAADLLKQKGFSVGIVDAYSIKPIDKSAILEEIEEGKMIFTIEDHNTIGGLGSAVAEVIAETGKGKLCRLGVNDCFGTSGKYDYLFEEYELSGSKIAKRIEEVLV